MSEPTIGLRRIAILGATGFVGRTLTEQAQVRGHDVRALVRSAATVPAGVEAVVGDYFDRAAVADSVDGASAVLSTIGPPPRRDTTLTPDDFGRAMNGLVEELDRAGIRRFVHIASTGTRYRDERLSPGRRLVRLALRPIAPLVIPAKERELAVLDRSDLDWTSVRPPVVSERVRGRFHADLGQAVSLRVDVGQLAAFMLDSLNEPRWFRTAPFVGTVRK